MSTSPSVVHEWPSLARLRENLIDLELAIADTGIDEDDGARLAALHALRRQNLDALARRERREVRP